MSSAVVDSADLYQTKTPSTVGDLNGDISPICDGGPSTGRASPSSPQSATHHVGFSESDSIVCDSKERERYLTAKYPKHQMGLIRKRLAVEDWVDSELKSLFDVAEEDYRTYDTILDLDELLNLDTDAERTEYIRQKISHAQKSEDVLAKFVEELLKKANTL